MKAIIFTQYGSPDVLELQEVERPVPKDDEVLVKVHAVSLNDWDYVALDGSSLINRLIFGLFGPKIPILGSDIAGEVVSVGKQIVGLRAGDHVFGDLSGRWGGFAEYVCAHESALALKAPEMSFEQAASIPQAAMLALQGLRAMGEMKSGQKLLINGAGGGVGTFAIQLAKLDGVEITAVDSTDKLEMLHALGADHVIDYAQVDFTKNGQLHDLILDVKTTRSIFDCARALSPNGVYVTVGGDMSRLFQTLLLSPWIALHQHKKMRILSLKPNQGLETIKELFQAGKLVPILDRTFPLSETREAYRYFGTGRHKGKVVILVEN